MATSVLKGNNGVCTTNAERISVSKTSGAVTDSAVKSVTKDLRLAYPDVECNITNV
tara:strand:- start:96 stop:263 length:168 start_codon:yes stop_codon:yes gene_type:complete